MRWKVIKPLICVEDPAYLTRNWARTVLENEFGSDVAKLDYVEQFNCLPFLFSLEEFEFDCFKKRKVDMRTRQLVRNRITRRDKGRVDPTFAEKHGLHFDSCPSK